MLDRLTFISLCIFIFVLPVSKAGVEIFSSLAILLWFIQRTRLVLQASDGKKFEVLKSSITLVPFSTRLPLFLYALFCLLSIFLSWDPFLSLGALFTKFLQGFFLFYVCAVTLNSKRRIMIFLNVFLLSAAILVCDGLWQWQMGKDFFKGFVFVRGAVTASMSHPNDLGAYLVMAISVALGFFVLSYKQRMKKSDDVRDIWRFVFRLVSLILMLGVLILTYSRAAWVGLLCGAACFACIKRSWKIVFGAVIVFLFIIIPFVGYQRGFWAILDMDSLTSVIHSILAQSFDSQDRWIYWKQATVIIKDHLFLGTGLNTYSIVVKEYSQNYRYYPHNAYLHTAAEIGVLGLGAMLWFIGSIIQRAWKKVKSPSLGTFKVVLVSVLAGYIGLLVQSFFDTTFYSVQLSMLLWAFMGLLVSMSGHLVSDEA